MAEPQRPQDVPLRVSRFVISAKARNPDWIPARAALGRNDEVGEAVEPRHTAWDAMASSWSQPWRSWRPWRFNAFSHSARYDLYEIRQILLPPSSDTSSDPSGSCNKPTGRPQTSRFSGASMNPVKNSFGPLCGLPPLNGMKATE